MGEPTQRTPSQELVAQIRGDQFRSEIASALPNAAMADRFIRAAVTAVNQNPELVTVDDKGSFFSSVIRCAQDGLLPDGREAAIVIYKTRDGKKAQYLPMIGGYRKIAAKHGMTLNAFVVYEGDEFEYTLGEDPHVMHKPPRLGEDRGEPIGAYAVATYEDGRMVCPPEVMDKAQIEQVRAVSRASDSEYGPWKNWWDRMARKTVARLLFKQLPLEDLDEREARIAAAADQEADLEPSRMTEDEANLHARLGVKPLTDGGPVDVIDGEAVDVTDDRDPDGLEQGEQPVTEQGAQGDAAAGQQSFAEKIPPAARKGAES